MHLILRSEGLVEARKRKEAERYLLAWGHTSAAGLLWAVLQYDYRPCSLKSPQGRGKGDSESSTWLPAGDDAASIILHSLQVKELEKESEDREKAVEKDEKKR